jgi:hypothetical protein
MNTSAERSRTRIETLRKLADDHALSPNARSSAGEDLAAALAAPERLSRWCAVTYLVHEGTAYLDPHHVTAASARERAERYLDDPTFAELPVEVVNLDSAERELARLGVLSWDSLSR